MLSSEIKEITVDISDVVGLQSIEWLVHVVTKCFLERMHVNDISKIFIQREPSGKPKTVSNGSFTM